jgi:uncharacterized protein YdgA (DUF945 family)
MKTTSNITKEQIEYCNNKFGKGNFRIKWNHGGNSLYVKQLGNDGKNHFIMFAYDFENWIKEEMK